VKKKVHDYIKYAKKAAKNSSEPKQKQFKPRKKKSTKSKQINEDTDSE